MRQRGVSRDEVWRGTTSVQATQSNRKLRLSQLVVGHIDYIRPHWWCC